MTILILGEQSAATREIEQALSAERDWSVRFERSPGEAAVAIAAGRAQLAVVRIRGGVEADASLARELCRHRQTPVVYVFGHHPEEAWAHLGDTRPLAWITEPFERADLRLTVDVAMRRAVEERRLRDEVRRTHDFAALMAAETAVLAEQVGHLATLLRAVPPGGAAPPADADDAGDQLATLTARERQIVELVRQGGRVHSIAGELGLRAGTVRNHLSAAFRKLGVRSQGQLVSLLRTCAPPLPFQRPFGEVRAPRCQEPGTRGPDSRQPSVRRVLERPPGAREPVTKHPDAVRRQS
jgi:DNA-binding NarL/FixJ family response regulator